MNPAATELSLQTHINQLKKSSESLQPARYASLLQKCAEQKSAAAGKLVHQHILSSGCGVNRYLQNHLIFMYAKCGCLQDAVEVFELLPCPNVFSWTALITAYAKEGHLREVLGFFRKMQLDGTKPDAFVFSTVLTACSSAGALNEGKAIHDCVVLAGMETQVVGNAIVNLYGKCGRVHEAKAVFERLPERNLVSWNALIAANAQNGHCKDAMQVFQLMDLDGSVRPNDATFVSVVDACSNLLDLPRGKSTHERIIRTGFDSYLFVGNSLVNMYGKCGSVDHARLVFEKMRLRDVLSWTSLIAAYALNGHRSAALEWNQKMDLEGIPPNDITFVSILFACGHSGLVYQGRDFFVSMVEDHSILPTMEHYGCMIDLLARAGWLEEATQLINLSPFGHKSFEWLTLLGACKMHGNQGLASQVAKRVFVKDPMSASPYMLLLRTKTC
ncbi:pentatricopeptide repeat-containing protein At3g46790, chloroplastic-like [Selaginella moellendorffii]|uniref:pentatricopeptide repeat-containing protein At3g46790, chloroplastic-like n=1 Tax=Selaginella moellendorffii TaxID=88036 RepID=UPI000D1C64D4|nr:pentatricopeptide repeat-containing protein At3g46790, chloroplastic-like [Selaginella moellendorffii]|eukprot:XP_024530845.1 pentatricopeptide repeat-containing protein At3g46790, chloroplastic-like [Selaginella moellendorffii]